jgi:hypothetical protein
MAPPLGAGIVAPLLIGRSLVMHLRRPSPTSIIAVLALFFALGGTAIAAHHYLISNTKQIKPSVLKKLKGNAGKNGTNGTNGTNGKNGAPGTAGASNGYIDQHPGPGEYIVLEEEPSVVSVLNLPAGKYVVQADVHLEKIGTGAQATCKLAGTTTPDEGVSDLGEAAGDVTHADLALSGALTLSAPGSVSVECTPVTVDKVAAGATMTAVQVTNLTSSTG